MATILETINTVTDKIVSLVGTRANKDLSNLTALGEAKLASGTAGLPVGSVIAYMGTDVPQGYLLMDGRTLSRTTYKALFDVIGTSQGEGDGSTTFGIADMTDGRYLMGSTVAGGRLSASATKLYGEFGPFKWGVMEDEFATGAFTFYHKITHYSNTGVSGSSKGATCFSFNSDNISNIFNSSTDILRPLSLQVRWFIKY